MFTDLLFLLLVAGNCYCLIISQQPLYVAPVTTNGACPSYKMRGEIKNNIQEEVGLLLHNKVIPSLRNRFAARPQFQCPCGGPGKWTRIAHLNMSDPSQQCPSNWNLITTPVRGCGGSSLSVRGCDSVVYPSSHQSYSYVCGRVNAYQKGTPDAFAGSNLNPRRGLENEYIDGVSLTHGAVGSRHHIWSFVEANYEAAPNFTPIRVCPCINTNVIWPLQIPTFIGNNYFCATGNPGPEHSDRRVYSDDLLWDGEGCGPTNTCCQFNSPPWFCATLPQPTTDDIELRICQNEGANNEDAIVSLVDIYIQ